MSLAGEGLPDLGSLRYEELVALLEDLTRRMASGDVGIEEAARLYEQAGVVHRAAAGRLESVTARLAAIAGGEAVSELEDPADSGSTEPPTTAPRARSRGGHG